MHPLAPGIVALMLLLVVFGAPGKGDDKDGRRKGRGGRPPHMPPMGHGGVSIVINNGELVDSKELLESASNK